MFNLRCRSKPFSCVVLLAVTARNEYKSPNPSVPLTAAPTVKEEKQEKPLKKAEGKYFNSCSWKHCSSEPHIIVSDSLDLVGNAPLNAADKETHKTSTVASSCHLKRNLCAEDTDNSIQSRKRLSRGANVFSNFVPALNFGLGLTLAPTFPRPSTTSTTASTVKEERLEVPLKKSEGKYQVFIVTWSF